MRILRSSIERQALLGLLHFEAPGERGILKQQRHLVLGRFRLALAVVTAEAHLGTRNLDHRVRVDGTPLGRAFHWFGLLGNDRLMVGLRCELGGVLLERGKAVAAAENELAIFVVSRSILINRMIRYRTDQIQDK